MYSVLDIAAYIIQFCQQHNYYMSNLKLQKVLYFVQAEFLLQTGQPGFYEDIEAWDFGPVVPIVYRKYRKFGSSNIIDYSTSETYLLPKARAIIEDIVKICNTYSSAQLVNLTHRQSPWLKAYRKYHNNIITTQAIKEFFEN